MPKFIHILKLILRILLGAFFITTAIFKILSLDNFEIYIYSFKLFGFAFSAFVARCVILAELLLGGLLISKICYKPAWWATMAMLIGFTLLLIYVAMFRHDANCHCLGDIVPITPVWSIVKNVVTMALLLLVRKEEDYHFKGKVIVGIGLLLASIAVPFACFPMDSFYQVFSHKEYKINEDLMSDFFQDSLAQSLDLNSGNYVVGFIASGCPYCRISGRKINTIVENNQLNHDKVVFVIWGTEEGVNEFKEDTQAGDYRYANIDPVLAVNLVMGQFPTYVMVKDGKVEKAFDLRGFDEHEIVQFLSEQR